MWVGWRLAALTFAAACSPHADRGDRATRRAVAPPADSAAAPVTFYATGPGPRAVAVADLDGDGRGDAVVGNTGNSTLSIWFGGEGPGFVRSATVTAGNEPADVDAVLVDGDGTVDLVIANHETSDVTVLLNDGTGAFRAMRGSPFATGARPHVHSVAAADFDGDGRTDLAVESADTREVRVLRGSARGLNAPVAIGVGTMPYTRLDAGKPGREGTRVILVPGHGDSTVRAVGFRDGGLRLEPWTIRLATRPWAVTAGDVTGDGADDLAVVETDAVSIWAAEGDDFASTPVARIAVRGATDAAVGDLDGDGVADVAVGPWDGDVVTMVLQRGRVVRTVRVCERPIGLAIAELDGDGRGELLVGCATSSRLAVVTPFPRE